MAFYERKCTAYLDQGAALDADTFLAWFDKHKGANGWVQEQNRHYCYPLHYALSRNVPRRVSAALLAAWPGAAKVGTRWARGYPLHLALGSKPVQAVSAALLFVWPGAAREPDMPVEPPPRNNRESAREH